MLSAKSFKNALSFVQHVINPAHDLPGLRGVMFEFVEGQNGIDTLYLVACDGIRMAVVQMDVAACPDLRGAFIIAPDQLQYLGTHTDEQRVRFSKANGANGIVVEYGNSEAFAHIRNMPKETQWPDWRKAVNQQGWPAEQEKGFAAPYIAAAAIAITNAFGPTMGFKEQNGPLILQAMELPKDEMRGVVGAFVTMAPRVVFRQ